MTGRRRNWPSTRSRSRYLGRGSPAPGVRRSEGIDTGPIITQVRFPIGPQDTAGHLRRRGLEVGARMFRDWWPTLVVMAGQGRRFPARPQDESKAHYYDRHSLPPLDPDDPVSVRAHTL